MAKKPKVTPMMQQYNEIKAQYPDALLFYRLGDFYELFNEDAILGAKLLELTLTQRNKNSAQPVPMAGVPHHAAQSYIDILVDKGYKVAVVEQMEDPAQAEGMVKREVIQLVTPGTRMKTSADAAKENNYMVALSQLPTGQFGLAYADLSTGELEATTVATTGNVMNELSRLETKEIVTDVTLPDDLMATLTNLGILVSYQSEGLADHQLDYLVQDLAQPAQKHSADLLLAYLMATQKRSLDHLQVAKGYDIAQYLELDRHSRANLELTSNIRTQQRSGTLLWLLDLTKTAMGGRLLKQWIEQPLLDRTALEGRYDIVGGLLDDYFGRAALQEALQGVYDLERLAGRVAFGSANGRDLLQLSHSLEQVPAIMLTLQAMDQHIFGTPLADLDPVSDIQELISQAITDDPPVSVKEGGLIKDGYNAKLDEYRYTMQHGKQWLADLEASECEATGIHSLKIGYNKVFGYYIEVTKANIDRLDPDRYTRKQTLVNAERFITPELKEHEQLILEAQAQSSKLEYDLFTQLRDTVKMNITRLQKLGANLARLDVLQSLATVAEQFNFVRPQLTDETEIEIKDGRHPVVEKVLGHQAFVANDVVMPVDETIMLITGPNMSGKSTYMRQLALTVVMAQIGSFVPATSAKLPIFDHIFTRIGAADDLISGNSTFMVEMAEANTALQEASPHSLILFDELGRGTATYDGMALAQAIIEYVHDHTQAKTLFSTHYHELTSLDTTLPHLKNVHVGATEEDGKLIFSHKVLPGPADQSYGINVAKLAGLPEQLIKRASEILQDLEASDQKESQLLPSQAEKNSSNSSLAEPMVAYPSSVTPDNLAVETRQSTSDSEQPNQLALFDIASDQDESVLAELKTLDLANMTPLETLLQVSKWQAKLGK